jgi:hypothetical protein
MWSIATEKIPDNPNGRDGDIQPALLSVPTRWFWSDELQAWTRNVAKRTYYTTKKLAEAASVYVAGRHPHLIGGILILAASDIAIENAMAPKREENPF